MRLTREAPGRHAIVAPPVVGGNSNRFSPGRTSNDSRNVFVLVHHDSRRLLHFNVTAHPTAAWTLQQLRNAVGFEQSYRYLIHDRDSIFARALDESLKGFGLRTLKSPPHSPMANAICERVIGIIRRECLDWMIPIFCGRRYNDREILTE